MLKRRKQKNNVSTENHERWLVSYADFITLLLAFFIVMYAVSSINEGKYRILSHSLVNAFKSNNSSNLISAQSAEFTPIHIVQSRQVDSIKLIGELGFHRAKKQERMQSMAKSILHALAPLV
jgi:chemotaxis protein MotB